MKKKIVFASALVIFAFVINTETFSQDKKFFAGILGGISLPVGELSYGYKPGFDIEGRLGVKTSEHFAAGIDVYYNTFSRKESNSIYSGLQNIFLSIKGLMLFKEFNSVSKFVPYATIAAGVSINKRTGGRTIWGEFHDTEFYSLGVDVGGGVSFKASKDFDIDLETKLNSSFDNPVRIFSVNFKAGINYNF